MHIYIHTHEQSKNSATKVRFRRVTWQTKEIRNYIYQLRTKLTKAQLENKTKARCQVGNKAMKRKLSSMLRGKEKKNRYAKLNRGR